ncbi:uncharacterized protein [Cardiocondyla obscurior]|uniref:uncharacterized protein n=1 Tax=Cardiocondyla obscurior TaxID=286306 RepID=UPI00396566F7
MRVLTRHMRDTRKGESSTNLVDGITSMDFQNVNSLNAWLNLLSGNLMPITNNSSFPISWKLYGTVIWLFQLFYTVTLIASFFFVPIEKTLNDGLTVLIVIMEENSIILRIHQHSSLIQQLIQKLNDAFNIKDENLKNIVTANLNPMKTPFKFYFVTVFPSLIVWFSLPNILILERNTFYYVDYKAPAIYSKEPFSTNIFVLGNTIMTVANLFIFLKKISVEVYIAHLISLVTSQYQYIALRFVLIFQNYDQPNINRDIRNVCRQHKNILYITQMLRKFLSLTICIIYLNNVFRFCFLGFMMSRISVSLFDGFMIFIYASGSVIQFYIICNCFQKLSEAASEITDKAFHENWYKCNSSVKRVFLLMIMASNNLTLKLALFERFNLNLSSFMSVR